MLTPADDQKGCPAPGVVLSHAFWQKQYGGDPSIVGRSIDLDGHPFDVIGVAQMGFFGVDVGRTFDITAPICAEPISRGTRSGLDKPDAWFLDVLGRLKDGWTVERAEAQLRCNLSIAVPGDPAAALHARRHGKLPRVQAHRAIGADWRVCISAAPIRRRCGFCWASPPSFC